MAKNSEVYMLTAAAPGMEVLEGVLISATEHGIKFRSRKPGSSTKQTRFFSSDRVIACRGKIGQDAVIYVLSQHVPVFRSGKRGKERGINVTNPEPLGLHLLTMQDDNGNRVYVNKVYQNLVSEEKDENAPKRGRKASNETKKEKPKAKAKGKAVKPDDWQA